MDFDEFVEVDESRQLIKFTHHPFSGKKLRKAIFLDAEAFDRPAWFQRQFDLLRRVVIPQQQEIKELREQNRELRSAKKKNTLARSRLRIERDRVNNFKEAASIVESTSTSE